LAARRLSAAAKAKRDKLVESHIGIVQAIARQLAAQIPNTFDVEDLVSEGCLALTSAATRYRPKDHGGAPFSAYARFRVRGAMLDFVGGKNWERAKRTDSLDTFEREDETFIEPDSLRVQPQTEATIDSSRLTSQLRSAIAQLPARLQTVVILRYHQGAQFDAIAHAIGVKQTRASNLHVQALTELRSILRTSGFRPQ